MKKEQNYFWAIFRKDEPKLIEVHLGYPTLEMNLLAIATTRQGARSLAKLVKNRHNVNTVIKKVELTAHILD